MPSPSPWSALPANSVSSVLGPETFLVKYPSSPIPGPIPFAAGDFAVIEDVRDLTHSHPINYPRKLRLRIIPSWMPAYPPDFLLVCRDANLSSCRWYGIRLHRSVLWRNGGKGIRGSLGEAPMATGYQFSHLPICVLHTIVRYLYTSAVSYDRSTLPFSEGMFLMHLYRAAVNKGLPALADLSYSHLRHPETKIGDAGDIRGVLMTAFLGMIGKSTSAAGAKRREEIRSAVVGRFAVEIWERMGDDEFRQMCTDSVDFAGKMLECAMEVVRMIMKGRGVDLDELD